MGDVNPYRNGLWPWFGFGGTAELTEADSSFAKGVNYDYRTRRVSEGNHVAERRSRADGVWKEISRGHKTQYIAGSACADEEGADLAARAAGQIRVHDEEDAALSERFHEVWPAAAELRDEARGLPAPPEATEAPQAAPPPRKLSAVERLKAGKPR